MTTPTNLADSILSVLAMGPAECDTIVSRLGLDASHLNEVAGALATLCSESRATFTCPTIMQMYELA